MNFRFHLFTWHELKASEPNLKIYRLPLGNDGVEAPVENYMHRYVSSSQRATATSLISLLIVSVNLLLSR